MQTYLRKKNTINIRLLKKEIIQPTCVCVKLNVRENRRGNQELTIQKHRQHRTQDEDQQIPQIKLKTT